MTQLSSSVHFCFLCGDLCCSLSRFFVMKVLIILAVTLGVCLAQKRQQNDQYDDSEQTQAAQGAPQQGQDPQNRHTTPIPIIRFDKEQGSDGSYKAAYETGNNIIAQEEGFLKDLGPDPEEEGVQLAAQVQQGSYSYTAPDGQIITVNYIADETGFHPTGDHLPTPPPVSPEVQKGLDLIYAGIKAQQEADEREAREHPGQQKSQNQIDRDFNGQYKP